MLLLVWLPEPLTVATLMLKSLTRSSASSGMGDASFAKTLMTFPPIDRAEPVVPRLN